MTRSEAADVVALFRRFAWPHRLKLALLTVVGLAAGAAGALQPLVLAPAIDLALAVHGQAPPPRGAGLSLNTLGATLVAWLRMDAQGHPFRTMGAVAALWLGVTVVAGALTLAAAQLVRWVRLAIADDIQSTLFARVLRLPLAFHHRQRVGELSSRLLQDAVVTAYSFDPVVSGLVESGVQVAVYGTLLVKTDALLTAGLAGVSLLHLAVNRWLRTGVQRQAAAGAAAAARVSAHVTEGLLGVRVVQSFGAEQMEATRLMNRLRRLRSELVRVALAADSAGPLRDTTSAAAVAAALLLSFAALTAGRLSLPAFVLFVVVARQATVPLARAAAALTQIHVIAGASRRVRELLEIPLPPDGALPAGRLESSLRLEGVTYEYTPGVPALAGIDIEIVRGQVIAIVGPSGSGKSTLLDLLLRLAEPTTGRVTCDGTDIRLFRGETYRCRFGVVPQDALLFNASIEDNVAYGRQRDEAEVRRALGLAHALDFVDGLPEGTQTVLGDRGVRLSGGERQRIAIARAVYGRPDVLVFDEATSALDGPSERLVREAIADAVTGTTAVIVAHRLSTVTRADRIFVMDAGRLVATGRHAELLGASPLYRRLAEGQFLGSDGETNT